MSKNLTADGCSSGEHVPVCQCDACLLRSELAEARSMHRDTLRAFEKYEQVTRAEHAAALAEAKRREDKAIELTAVTHAGNVKLHADRETLRSELSEHASALGLATARIRELEGERDELRRQNHQSRVARIEKATKGTT